MARFLTRVRLENYKSIAHCDVELQDLTFLVGPNGAGKSNFLSSFYFLQNNAFRGELKTALNILEADDLEDFDFFKDKSQEVELVFSDFLLVKMKMVDKKCHVYFNSDSGIMTKIYNLNEKEFVEPEKSSGSRLLNSNGSNLASILFDMKTEYPRRYSRITQYMQKIVPDLQDFLVLRAGGYDILQFKMTGSERDFNASQMSDGTLHALGVLTAIFHAGNIGIPLIGVEEPEAGLHPAAAQVLYDALAEASEDVQIIVTSHSPDLLDNPDISPDSILAVVRENGETKIGPINETSRQVLNEHMFTAGELLRLNRLLPAA